MSPGLRPWLATCLLCELGGHPPSLGFCFLLFAAGVGQWAGQSPPGLDTPWTRKKGRGEVILTPGPLSILVFTCPGQAGLAVQHTPLSALREDSSSGGQAWRGLGRRDWAGVLSPRPDPLSRSSPMGRHWKEGPGAEDDGSVATFQVP